MTQSRFYSFFGSMVLVFLAANNMAKTELVIATTDIHNPPFVLCDGQIINGAYPGVSIELIQQAAKSLNLDIEFRRVPWARALKELKTSRVNAIFHASYNEQRKVFGKYPESLEGDLDRSRRMTTRSYYLYLPSYSQINWDGTTFNLSEGSSIDIGVMRRAAIVGILKNHKNLTIKELNSPEQYFRQLHIGRLDAIAELESFGDNELSTRKYQYIEKHPIPLTTKDYYLIFSKDFYKTTPDTAESIWNEFKRFNQSGEIQRLFAKYASVSSRNSSCHEN